MTPRSRISIAVAVVQDGERFLVGERPSGTALAGHAEFPGGKVEPGEALFAAAVRECREETGLTVQAEFEYACVEHDYEHAHLTLHFVACRLTADAPPIAPYRWVRRDELVNLPFPPANCELIRRLTLG